MLKIRNKNDKEAEIFISGDIIDDQEGDFLSAVWGVESGYEWPAKIRQQLDELKGKDLTIYINSDGGLVNAGVAMANMIARHDGHTTAIIDGWCCSIATQIFFAADERKMPANAYLMIHKPTGPEDGNADDHRKVADILDTLQEGLESTYRKAKLDGVTDGQITAMVNDETWLTGEDAAKIFKIEVLEPSEAAACAAGKRPVNFKKAPKVLQFAARDKPEPESAGDDNDHEIDKAKINIALALAKGVLQ